MPMATRKRGRAKLRIKGRFFLMAFIAVGFIALVVLLITKNAHRNEIQFGSLDATLTASAAIIRDERLITSEPYEKVTFNVVEGQTISNGDLVAQVYKRGYQEDTTITLLNLQKQIYAYQLQLLGANLPAELVDVNERITTVEEQIRATSRKESVLDMLDLEQSLRGLQAERETLLASIVPADATLTQMYTELAAQQQTQNSWKRDILNESGTGIVSFYFDGYERVLTIDKLSTINAALVNSVVKGGNTAAMTDANSESPLYRITGNTHWFIAFVTKASEPLRLAAGEQYTVQFPDYSDQMYTVTARECSVSENSVVNVLEFNTDIGKLAGVRTVAVSVSKSAQGLVVPLKAITIESGVPGITISLGDENVLRVEVDILSQDEKNAVIRAKNDAGSLTAGQKFVLP